MNATNNRTILVTTDLSDEATSAYTHAASLARALNAPITLLTYLDTSMQYGLGAPFDAPVVYLPEPTDSLKDSTATQLKGDLEKYFPGIAAVAEVRETSGPIQHAIIDYIKDHTPLYVVMASHGRSGVARALLGSITEQVIRGSTSPVVVIPVGVATRTDAD